MRLSPVVPGPPQAGSSPEERDGITAALEDRFDILRELGAGGMATVYLARDLRLGREVAIKVLRPEVAEAIGERRFLNEIELVARFTHPNILDLHESGEANGTLYYVMPFLPEGSLRDVLDRGATMDRTTVLALASEVADALAYAHAQGVIHRDVKPENILLSHGHAMIADFGIAKAIGTVARTRLTRTGFPLGTPGYMSPEQAAALPDIDAQTDVYGLGCVVYELLIGEPPGLWPTDDAIRLGRFQDAPAGHRERLDRLPGRWEQALVQALAMRRGDRFASPLDFTGALAAAPDEVRRFGDDAVRTILARAAEVHARTPTIGDLTPIGIVEEAVSEIGIPRARVREAARELPGGGPRREWYDDSGVRELVGRAVALEDAALATATGLTAGSVERVAAEVGIPPERVRDAIADLDRERGSGRWMFGREPVLVVERTGGGRLDEPGRGRALALIRSLYGREGFTGADPDTLLWRSTRSPGREGTVSVAMTVDGSRTAVRLQHDVRDLGGEVSGSVLGWVAGGIVGAGVAFSLGLGATVASPVLGLGLAVAAGYAATRWYVLDETRQRRERLERLGDQLAALVEGEVPNPG